MNEHRTGIESAMVERDHTLLPHHLGAIGHG
jgi:hypothetical protein